MVKEGVTFDKKSANRIIKTVLRDEARGQTDDRSRSGRHAGRGGGAPPMLKASAAMVADDTLYNVVYLDGDGTTGATITAKRPNGLPVLINTVGFLGVDLSGQCTMIVSDTYKGMVSANDTTPAYLIDKFASSDGTIVIAEVGDPGDEDVDLVVDETQLDGTLIPASDDWKVMVSADDTTPDYLNSKILEGNGLTFTETGPGVDEDITIAVDETELDLSAIPNAFKVMVSADDTTPDYLNSKILAGDGIAFTETGPGVDEDITIAADPDGDDLEISAGKITIKDDGVHDHHLHVDTAGDGLAKVGAGPLNVGVKNSIEIDADELQLVNDEAAPGNSEYYGTGGAGAKGWNPLPTDADTVDGAHAADLGHGTVDGALKDHSDVAAAVSDADVRGDIIVRNAANWTRLAKGADNTVLACSATDPQWETLISLLSTLPDYDGGKTQALLHISGTLTWVDTDTCS